MVTLQTSKLFSHLPAAELQNVWTAVEERHFGPGEQIFKEGDPGDGIYIVKSGSVQISAMAAGQHVVFARVPPGEVFGEMAVLDNQPRSAFASAETETTVFFLPREKLLGLLKGAPDLALNLLQELVARFREFNRQYLHNVMQAERMTLVGRFASAIVHDLKNPLMIIDMAAQLGCGAGADPDLRREARGRIGKQVKRIADMVNDILEFARGAPVAARLAPENFAVVVNEFVADVRPELEAGGVTLQLINQPPEVVLSINRQRITRLLHNLVSNADDAMPDGGVIRLGFDVNERELTTRVEDSGKGIAPEIADRLFEPFATFGKARGTGLGLSICQRIVQEHGGSISAGNQPRGGAVFAFTLPLTK
jgi:two-component system, NtrC family, sensor histidine kinase HydH